MLSVPETTPTKESIHTFVQYSRFFLHGLILSVPVLAWDGGGTSTKKTGRRGCKDDEIRHVVEDSVKSSGPISLIVKDGEFYKTLAIDYHGGEQYPHLERDPAKPDLLGEIIRPHTGGK